MIKRTLFIGSPCELKCKDNQLTVTNLDTGELSQSPIEDIGYIVFDNPASKISHYLIQELSQNNVGTVFCDKNHLPSSMLLHLDTNLIQTELFSYQINAKQPLKNQLWQQTIKAKIRNQAGVLKKANKDSSPLEYSAKKVRSGDSSNHESKAARYYWKTLLGKNFKRERYGLPPNNALNYGYAILRAAVARALSGSGLLPTLGIHHKNRYNSFCLADDVMEPYRPYVDLIVHNNYDEIIGDDELSKAIKVELLNLFGLDVLIDDTKSPLMIALSRTSSSLSRCLTGDSKKIVYPVIK